MTVHLEQAREEPIRDRVSRLTVQDQKTYYRSFVAVLKDPDTYAA
ncbi:MAG: hypothetical protein V7725_00380 [Porticoccus sp.]